jgi:hypothetical protein
MTALVRIDPQALSTLIASTGEPASIRFLKFFAANIRDRHRRRRRSMGDLAATNIVPFATYLMQPIDKS